MHRRAEQIGPPSAGRHEDSRRIGGGGRGEKGRSYDGALFTILLPTMNPFYLCEPTNVFMGSLVRQEATVLVRRIYGNDRRYSHVIPWVNDHKLRD